MRVGLDCVHELPATYADMVDKDYLCPVVIYALAKKAEWKPNENTHWLADNVYLKISSPDRSSVLLSKLGRRWYYSRYGEVTYYVIMDGAVITNEMLPTAFDMLNDALSHITVSLIEHVRDITFYYESFLETSVRDILELL